MSRWASSIAPYADWLNNQRHDVARDFGHRITAEHDDQVEGAVAEAVAWDYLNQCVDEIACFQPASLTHRSPDFQCRTNGQEFVVEVTNLSRALVTQRTKLEDPLPREGGLRSYADWTHLVKRELSAKSAQGTGLSVPYVVFVTTLHAGASIHLCSKHHVESILHSPAMIAWDLDGNMQPASELYESTDFRFAAFCKAGSAQPERRNLSCVLIGGFGPYNYPTPAVHGLEHPDSVRPLPRGSIRYTPLCYFRVWPPDPRVLVAWTDESESELPPIIERPFPAPPHPIDVTGKPLFPAQRDTTNTRPRDELPRFEMRRRNSRPR